MVNNWTKAKIFSEKPLLDPQIPLDKEEDFDKYFVELEHSALKKDIFELKNSPERLQSIFNQKILIVGDFKVGKTTLKNYIISILTKNFKILRTKINIGNFIGSSLEVLKRGIFSSWYKKLCEEMQLENPKECSELIDFQRAIVSIYRKKIDEQKIYDYAIVDFDEANRFTDKDQVYIFRDFCTALQGMWEIEFESNLGSKIGLVCCGNLGWFDDFQLGENISFGIFPKYYDYGDNWNKISLKLVLTKRISNVLIDNSDDKIRQLIPDSLVERFHRSYGNSIKTWLEKYRELLEDFIEKFGDKFEYFDKFVSDAELYFDYQERYIKQYKCKSIFDDLKNLRKDIKKQKFGQMCEFLEFLYNAKNGVVMKSQLEQIIKAKFPLLNKDLILNDFSLGKTGAKPEKYHNPPINTTPDNQALFLNERFQELLHEIKKNFNKKPGEFLKKHIEHTASDSNEIEQISLTNLEISMGFIEDLIKITKDLKKTKSKSLFLKIKNLLKEIIEELKQNDIQEDPEISESNRKKMEIKNDINKILGMYIEALNQIFQDSDGDKEFIFILIDETKSPIDNFDYKFHAKIDINRPSGLREVIENLELFAKNTKKVILDFLSLNNSQQRNLIQTIRTKLENRSKKIENFLENPSLELPNIDFKQGFMALDGKFRINEKFFEKLFQNISAMANLGKNKVGFIVFGVSDKDADTQKIAQLFEMDLNSITIKNQFGFVGIEREAKKLGKNLDEYVSKIAEKIRNSELNAQLKTQIGTDINIIEKYGQKILIIKIIALQGPVWYRDKVYVRSSSSKIEQRSNKEIDAVYRLFF